MDKENGALYLVAYAVNDGEQVKRVGRIDVRWASPAASMEDVAGVDDKLTATLRERGAVGEGESVTVLGWTRMDVAPS